MQSYRIKLKIDTENKFGKENPKIDVSEIENPRMKVKKKIKKKKGQITGGN